MKRTRIHQQSTPNHTNRPFFSSGSRARETTPFFPSPRPVAHVQPKSEVNASQELEEVQTQAHDAELESPQHAAGEAPIPPADSNAGAQVQAKLAIGQPNDQYEQEADLVADQVMRMPKSHMQRQPEEEESEILQPETLDSLQVDTAPSIVNDVLQKSGQPLDSRMRAFMESRFEQDFSNVRIHTDAQAADSAKSIQAKAYTCGNDIVFGNRQYNPLTVQGKWLLAHELTHVVQQESPPSVRSKVEDEANETAYKVLSGAKVKTNQIRKKRAILRFGEPENVPDITYISKQGPQGFLNSAVAYHNAWGLNPRRISSIEQIVDHLAGGNGILGRIRIVLHTADIGVYSSLFTNEPPFSIETPRLEAWSTSDVAGLEYDLDNLLQLTPSTVSQTIDNIRAQNPAILQPFNLHLTGVPTGALLKLFNRSVELEMLRQVQTPQNAADITVLRTSLNTILTAIKQQVQNDYNATSQQVNDFQTAVMNAGWQNQPYVPDADQVGILRAANTSVAGGFRDTLNRARSRFDQNSWIDIRGCNVGDTNVYLQAVSRFFGNPHALPHVSGPSWFQVFPIFASRTLTAGSNITNAAARPEITAALDKWSTLTGVRHQLALLRTYYQSELLRHQALSSNVASTGSPQLQLSPPPALLGGLTPPIYNGLPLPAADRSLIDLIQSSMLQRPLSRPISLLNPPSSTQFGLSLNIPPLQFQDPLESIIQQAIQRLTGADAELRFYLECAQLLPVFEGTDPQNFMLYAHNDLQRQAVQNWLQSQWLTNAPGLQQILTGQPFSTNQRRVQALVEHRVGQGLPGEQMVFPPDPEYWNHINRI